MYHTRRRNRRPVRYAPTRGRISRNGKIRPIARRRKAKSYTPHVVILLIVCAIIGFYAYKPTLSNMTLPGQEHSIQGSPSISAEKINSILCNAGSPACGKGKTLYDEGVAVGINPAYALAFFQHESSFGTAGVARSSRSLSNMRCVNGIPCEGGYAYFASWEQGFQAWYDLINNLYINQWHLTTIEQIIPRYAPNADNNDEQGYIKSVVSAVANWQS